MRKWFKIEESDNGYSMRANGAKESMENEIYCDDREGVAKTKEEVMTFIAKWLGDAENFEFKDDNAGE